MIRVAQDGAIWTLTLDRPDKANSLTAEMLQALCNAVDDATRQQACAIILTGVGRVFSAGADLVEARAGLATSPLWEDLSARIAKAECLTIAALNGTLAGGAFGMALACDLRLCVPGTKFFYPVMKLGFLPQPSDPGRLAALIGPARAKMILMAGARIEAEEARDWGLIDRIVAPDDLMEAARALCADALSAQPAHVAAIKRLVP
ncbi:enoyl-CoA hydratase/isomerase family protein [Roseinatronobacter sp.]|uniref:enoyl-CoA hydratase/isomerase family protein n=1 Tax=Roseinatronobacter sp. TaxID=1945755 RepID=UPI0025CD7C53|nr:enoyl-CoA hydratase/isomerase family protein [Rhodobaca sp.]